MSAKAMFSVKRLLDIHDHLQQDRQVDDAGVSDVTEGEGHSALQLSSITHDDPLMLAGACLFTGGEMSLMTAAASPSRLGGYADTPDVVQASAVTGSCCDPDNLYTRWLQSTASLDCFTGHSLQLD